MVLGRVGYGPSTFDRAPLMSVTQASHSSGTEKVAS